VAFRYFPQTLDQRAQRALLGELRPIIAAAPLYTPTMPRTGKPFSVRMTNCGPLGWVSDRQGGYRYQATHPETGKSWPAMPTVLLELWRALAAYSALPEACLINYYGARAKMGMHRDADEEDLAAPVLSISLGDTALFRMGGLSREAPSRKLELRSGDVVLLEGEERLAYHGIDRILPRSSDLLSEGGRLNLTLRRVRC
jgi:DNA oxidative demethylase